MCRLADRFIHRALNLFGSHNGGRNDQKTFDAKPQSIRHENNEIGKINRSQTENLSATVEAEVTMVPMQNQNPTDFANRIESKVEV